ncbi:hypothetical protein TFLX_00067 [Thermoflexales bacterium]|nr:hypothetical protein TFLX_00067 [Thermoflexales bacterium]
MLHGLLLLESLTQLEVLQRLRITRTETWNVAHAAEYQPKVWTAISFEVDDDQADALAEELSRTLKSPGWYIDARLNDKVYVIFPQRVFKYCKGDRAGQLEAQAYARAIGIPASQIDWETDA